MTTWPTTRQNHYGMATAAVSHSTSYARRRRCRDTANFETRLESRALFNPRARVPCTGKRLGVLHLFQVASGHMGLAGLWPRPLASQAGLLPGEARKLGRGISWRGPERETLSLSLCGTGRGGWRNSLGARGRSAKQLFAATELAGSERLERSDHARCRLQSPLAGAPCWRKRAAAGITCRASPSNTALHFVRATTALASRQLQCCTGGADNHNGCCGDPGGHRYRRRLPSATRSHLTARLPSFGGRTHRHLALPRSGRRVLC